MLVLITCQGGGGPILVEDADRYNLDMASSDDEAWTQVGVFGNQCRWK